jgi:hypothetical protein
MLQTDVIGHLVGLLQHQSDRVTQSYQIYEIIEESIITITALLQFGKLVCFGLCKD